MSMLKTSKWVFIMFSIGAIFLLRLADAETFKQLIDDEYFFKCSIPTSWNVEESKDITSFWRFWATSPNKDKAIGIYSLHIGGDIDLERFAGNDTNLFKDVGNVISTSKIKKWWIFTKAIDKTYFNKKKNLYCSARYLTDGTYGYVILAYSKEQDFDWLSLVANSFETSVPFFTNVKNKSSEIVKFLILSFLLFAVPVGLGLIGYATRRSFLGLILVFGLPLCLSGYLLYGHMEWWVAIGIGAICMACMGAGRVGFFIWGEID